METNLWLKQVSPRLCVLLPPGGYCFICCWGKKAGLDWALLLDPLLLRTDSSLTSQTDKLQPGERILSSPTTKLNKLGVVAQAFEKAEGGGSL